MTDGCGIARAWTRWSMDLSVVLRKQRRSMSSRSHRSTSITQRHDFNQPNTQYNPTAKPHPSAYTTIMAIDLRPWGSSSHRGGLPRW